MSLPVYVRDNTLLALGDNDRRPDYAWHQGTAFQLFQLDDGREAVCEVPDSRGESIFRVSAKRESGVITVRADGEGKNWTLCLRNIMQITHLQGATASKSETGLVITPQGTEVYITL